MKSIAFYILILLLSCEVYSQGLHRGVWGSGGTTATSGNTTIHGTVSQTAIGRSINQKGGVQSGFWYTLYGKLPRYDAGFLVVIPKFSAKAGDLVDMPVILETSTNLRYAKYWNFEGRIEFNATVLEPISNYDSYSRNGDTGIITFSGKSLDTAGIIKKISFKAKLGNIAISDVNLLSFTVKEYPKGTILTKNGEFSLEDLCYADGNPRLIFSLKQGLALFAYPLPASEKLTVKAETVELGNTEILLVGTDGKIISTLFSGLLKPGLHELPINTEYIPSGSYFLMMKTPSDLMSAPCIISK